MHELRILFYIFYRFINISRVHNMLRFLFHLILFFSFSPHRSSLPTEAWLAEARQMRQTLDRSLQKLLSSSDSELQQRVQQLRRTQIEHEVQRAMGKEETPLHVATISNYPSSPPSPQLTPARKYWPYSGNGQRRAAVAMSRPGKGCAKSRMS